MSESLIESTKESSGAEPNTRAIEHWSPCCYVRDDSDDKPGPLQQIQAFVDGYWYAQSQRPIDRSKVYTLKFFEFVVITRPMITLLRALLLLDEVSLSVHDDDKDNMDRPHATISNPKSIFSTVIIRSRCRFFEQDEDDQFATSPNHDDNVCTSDDKFCFLSALSSCTDRLVLTDCHEILAGLLNMIPEIDRVEAKSVDILQDTPLTDLEYIRLGAILENSIETTELSLAMYLADVPQAFCDSFANCIHIQSLHIAFAGQHTCTDDQWYSTFSKMVTNAHHNSALERLLRNPQNRLKELDLGGSNIEDHHVMVLAQLLACTHIEELNLSSNNINAPGLLDFAHQLPSMHSLTNIYLGDNPWEESSLEVLEECGAAFLHGLIENPSIQLLNCVDNVPQCTQLWHYLSLNCAGRKLLTLSSSGERPIPDGLWSLVLSRAGRPIEERGRIRIPICDEDGNYQYNGPANAVYFFLQNCPKLLFWQESLSTRQTEMLAS